MTSGARRRRKRSRATLRHHLEAQHMRGQGNPRERVRLNGVRGNDKGAPQSYSDPEPPVTIAEVWPRG